MGGSERSADDPLAVHNWTIWARPGRSRDACARCMPNSDVLIASVQVGGRSWPVCGTAATQPPMQRACGSSSAQVGHATGSCLSAGIAVSARPPGGLRLRGLSPPRTQRRFRTGVSSVRVRWQAAGLPRVSAVPSGPLPARQLFPDTEAYAKVSLKKYKPMAARNEDRNVSSGLL